MWARLTADDAVSLSDRLNKTVRAGQQLTVTIAASALRLGAYARLALA